MAGTTWPPAATDHLALGDPAKTAAAERCNLIAMTSHGHRLIGDIIYGRTISEVRHRTSIPILIVRAQHRGATREPTVK